MCNYIVYKAADYVKCVDVEGTGSSIELAWIEVEPWVDGLAWRPVDGARRGGGSLWRPLMTGVGPFFDLQAAIITRFHPLWNMDLVEERVGAGRKRFFYWSRRGESIDYRWWNWMKLNETEWNWKQLLRLIRERGASWPAEFMNSLSSFQLFSG